ncbi:DNA-binding response regulator, OmpR family, contains REC and winged-helix (wHTH) domain [Ruminococcus sp. YE71]|uniref:response regulator transcription factor n=1 Tax=unclassified Ruminococcus TaxID=2608920 RepID=UPI000891F6E0|nr:MULTISPECIES: response regulator transcription factor [unclassified Ruminococcus]SDA28183.1 DNA-binding response regulator, OmpR family, contains REC and winged-helix (wHTH) domain [Ruminococcus sp. YE78]SFW34989.1 DNA-binding response regulator, OmpR family, contains REC and winged-helix (wHTH) domain [Ruminococcus sp. YE71]
MYKILIADDEPDVVSLVQDYFELNGYHVMTASDGLSAVEQASKKPDIILLDINMPHADGIEVCKRIRDHVSCPIVFLTARIEDSDKIAGFAAGGDDYIIKPFSLDELGARVAAHIRRDQRDSAKHDVLMNGNLTIDYSTKTVTVGGKTVDLAKKEFQILELLSVNAGQIYDKERIYEKIWGFDAEGDSSVVAEHIRRLRSKLAKVGEDKHIETVWGIGYKWVT